MSSIFKEVLGDSPQIKVLDFLIDNSDKSWTMVEVRDGSNVGYSTLKVLLPKLLRRKLVIVDKKVGKSRLYKIDINNKAIKHLMAFDWNISVNEKRINMKVKGGKK